MRRETFQMRIDSCWSKDVERAARKYGISKTAYIKIAVQEKIDRDVSQKKVA